MAPYESAHPRPAVTVDLVVLCAGELLLIERGNEPFAGSWALPGGFVDPDERVEDAAARELEEETGVVLPVEELQLVGCFSAPGRDPRGWTISLAFAAHLDERPQAAAADDAAALAWHPLTDLPPLAFDHADVVAQATRA